MAGKPSVAAELLRRMQAAGIQPNVIAYTSLLSSYSATGDVEAAEAVLQEMEAVGCLPNSKSYTEVMSQLAAKGVACRVAARASWVGAARCWLGARCGSGICVPHVQVLHTGSLSLHSCSCIAAMLCGLQGGMKIANCTSTKWWQVGKAGRASKHSGATLFVSPPPSLCVSSC